jgi:anaerobic selenocysteine-containing dehydrogenase
MCGLVIETDGDRITAIRGDEDDPWSKGYLCPKGVALQDIHHDPNRLRQPVRRTPDGWEPISWQAALDTVAERLVTIQEQHGDDALGIYWGNPPTHSHGLILTMLPFFGMLRTRNRYSAASVDQLPQYLTNTLMFGNQVMFPVADIDRTALWLILGGNPVVSNGSISSAPDMRGRIKAIKARGGRVIVIDPRRTRTADAADEHHFIQPGSDVLLLLALLNVVFDDGLAQLGRGGAFTDGLETVEALVKSYTPERVAEQVGISAESIRQLARNFANAPSAVAYGRLGVSQNPFGAVCHWLINVLNIVTGNFDQPGGAMFTQPAFNLRLLAKLITGGGHYDKWRSRVRNLPEFSDEFPVATLADEMLTPGQGQIRAMLLLAGNPVLTTPNGQRLATAMGALNFCVAIDFYINESTRHADIILPPTSPLEHGNYEIGVTPVAVRNIARYSRPVFDAPAGGLDDWQIITELQARIWHKRGGFGRIVGPLWRKALSIFTPDRILDLGLRFGQPRMSLKQLKAAKHTLDLGPLQPALPKALYTRGKRINAAPAVLVADMPRVERHFFSTAVDLNGSLQLIGRRHLRSNNSWMHNSQRLMRGKPRCTLLMHSADATSRSLTDGQMVTVTSAQGSVVLSLEVSDDMMPGVVSIPHGWGHAATDTWPVARQTPGVSVNDLTNPDAIDAVSGNAAVNGVPIRVLPLAS